MGRKPTSRERQALIAAKAYVEASLKLAGLEFEIKDWNHQDEEILEIELVDKNTGNCTWWTV